MHEVPRRTQSCVQHSGHGAGADTRDMVLCDLHISIVKNYLLLIVLITCIQREDAKGAKLIAVSLSVKFEHLAPQCRISMSQHKALSLVRPLTPTFSNGICSIIPTLTVPGIKPQS